MKDRLLSLVLLASVVILACTHRQQTSRSPALTEGEYLSTTYIEEVKKTRSPLSAGRADRVHEISVRREGAGFLLQPTYNFHEGGDEFLISSNGSVSPFPTTAAAVPNLTATILDEKSFQFGYGQYAPTKYLYVKDASEYVGNTVLVGKYKDRSRRRYEFREDGVAVFPDRRFRFEIGLDQSSVISTISTRKAKTTTPRHGHSGGTAVPSRS